MPPYSIQRCIYSQKQRFTYLVIYIELKKHNAPSMYTYKNTWNKYIRYLHVNYKVIKSQLLLVYSNLVIWYIFRNLKRERNNFTLIKCLIGNTVSQIVFSPGCIDPLKVILSRVWTIKNSWFWKNKMKKEAGLGFYNNLSKQCGGLPLPWRLVSSQHKRR